MVESNYKGKYSSLFPLLFLVLASFAIILGNSTELDHAPHNEPETEPEIETRSSVVKEEILLNKLEELVNDLNQIVARLEPMFGESSLNMVDLQKNLKQEKVKVVLEEKSEGRVRDAERGKVVSVTKYSPFWSERFQFISAVKFNSDATCINVLPFRDFEGNSKYVAVGDDRGRIYMFLRSGDVLIEFYTECDSPVTAMVSYLSVYKNESIVVTGHENGVILMHKVYEGSNGEEMSTLSIANIGKYVETETGVVGSPVTLLEVHHVGRSRYILSSDDSGEIRVLRENGTLHGSAVVSSKPLAFLKQRLLFLTESGAGSLDLRTMRVRESECEGLNHSVARNYAFDATERSKAYGYTSDGDLIHLLLLGDITNFKCRVRSKRKFDMEEPLSLQAIKGYLLVASEEKVFVYNISSHHYVRAGGPRLLFSTGIEEIRSSFLNRHLTDGELVKKRAKPLIASDREKHVVLGLGGDCVGMYRSNLPVFKGEFNTMFWTSPVLFFILFLFGAWQFFAKKKEALTSWGPDDPFSSTSASATTPLVSSSGDKAFADPSSRTSEIMDLRPNSLMASSRRYVSPPRYPGGTTSSFRPTPADGNTRPASTDPSYRASAELKFRGPTLDSTGFGKRRESPYINSQNIDESNKL